MSIIDSKTRKIRKDYTLEQLIEKAQEMRAYIVDRNDLQIDGPTEEVMCLEPLIDKWQAFVWHTIEIDGHDMSQILEALDNVEKIKNKPTVIIAHTLKGKGVSFAEGVVGYHGSGYC